MNENWMLTDSVPAYTLGHLDVIYHDGAYRYVEIVEDDVDEDLVYITYEDEMGEDVTFTAGPFDMFDLYVPDEYDSLTI